MTTRTAKEIEDQRDAVTKESVTYLGRLERALENAKGQRLTEAYQTKLETEIAQSRASYHAILNRLEDELSQAKETETKSVDEEQAKIRARADQTKAQIKQELSKAWIAAGGDPGIFEKKFPEMYEAEMVKRASVKRDPEQSRAAVAVITKSF